MSDHNHQNLINQLGQYDPNEGQLPRVSPGNHTLALIDYFIKDTETGPAFISTFMVCDSDTAEPGACFGKAWSPGKSKFPKSTYGDINAFIIALLGLGGPDEVPQHATKLVDTSVAPGRGLLVRAFAFQKSSSWVDIQWTHVPADECVKERRDYIEANCPVTAATPAPVAAAPAPTPVAAPVPTAATSPLLPPRPSGNGGGIPGF